MWLIFDTIISVTLKAKASLVIEGHVVNSNDVEMSSSMMSTEGPRVLLTISDHMHYKVGVGDINNTYMYAITKEYVYTSQGLAFVKHGYVTSEQSLGMVVRAYGLRDSGYAWWLRLNKTLHDVGFIRSCGDSDIWL